MTSAEYSRSDGISRSVKFLWAGSGNNVIEDTTPVSREMTLQRLRKRNWRTFYMPVIRLLRLMISIACPIKIDAGSNLADLVRESKREKKNHLPDVR